MQERHRRASHSSNTESGASSSKRHQSVSQSRDEMGPKRGQQMPMEDWNSPGPMAGIAAPTLDWSQDILEPRKPGWKPAAGDGPAMPCHSVKSVVKMLEKPVLAEATTCAKVKPWIKPAQSELASCGKGRGWVIAEKLQELAGMGLVAASRYTSKEESPGKKPGAKKPTFPTPETQEERRQREEQEKRVVHHQEQSIGELYTSLKRQAHRYDWEVKALQFFHPEEDVDLACKVLAIADWVEEYNQLSTHPIPEIPAALLTLYSGSLQARGQFPLPPPAEEIRVTDVQTQSQAVWIFLSSILQYFEDDMAAREGALYGGRTWRPSALILYIMEHVNPGLPEHYRVQWPNIVAKTPWLTARNHLSKDEFHRFYQEPGPDTPLELEQATEDVYRQQVEDEAQRESDGHSLPLSCADGAEIWNSPGPQPPSHEGQQSSQPPKQEDRPHKFQPGPDWHMVTPSNTGLSTVGVQPGLNPLDQELGKDDMNDILGNYLEEQQSAVRYLIHANPGLTGSESPEAMDVDLTLPSEVANLHRHLSPTPRIRLWRPSPQRLHWEPSNQS